MGIENPEPDKSEDSTIGSWEEVALDVEEVLETTDALWAARSRESSRVRRFTCRWSVDSRATGVSQNKACELHRGFKAHAYHCLLLLFQLHMKLRSRQRSWVTQRTRARPDCSIWWRAHGRLWRRESGRRQGLRGHLLIHGSLVGRQDIHRRLGRRRRRWGWQVGRLAARMRATCQDVRRRGHRVQIWHLSYLVRKHNYTLFLPCPL